MASFKKIRRAARRPFETAAFRIFAWIVPRLPRCAVVRFSTATGWMAARIPFRDNRVALKNLDAVFGGTKTPEEKRRILATSFATMTQTMLDLFWFSKDPDNRIRKYVVFEEGSNKDSFFEDKPVVCITAHIGSWEVMGQTSALMGAKMASIAAPLKNPAVNQAMVELRERTGQVIIPQKGALKSLIARLRKNGKAAFVLDQNTPEREGGVLVNFLGFPMPVSMAPAALAYRTGTEIMLGVCLPEPRGHYRIRIPKIIIPPPYDKERDADQAALELTQQIQDGISREILKHPEHWLWAYRHWRRVPGKTYPPNYPDY